MLLGALFRIVLPLFFCLVLAFLIEEDHALHTHDGPCGSYSKTRNHRLLVRSSTKTRPPPMGLWLVAVDCSRLLGRCLDGCSYFPGMLGTAKRAKSDTR